MKKIYIVDDDPDIVESLTMVLESAGYEVGHQTTEDDVVENIKAFGADLVILDVMFPENISAGFDMARCIHDCDDTTNLPVIMLSAINERGIYAGAFSNKDRDDSFLPVSEFVEKPISPKSLLEKVEALIP